VAVIHVAVVPLADPETREGLGRAVKELEGVKEFKGPRDDVRLVLDRAGAKWPGVPTKSDQQCPMCGQFTDSQPATGDDRLMETLTGIGALVTLGAIVLHVLWSA
jgi:hypothetical protein